MTHKDQTPHVESSLADYRVVEHGPRQGETLLFLHGGNAAGWTWAGLVEHMPTRHVLTPDLPGYASRAAETWPGTARAADDIAELIGERALDQQAHVIGLSLGGFVAVQLLRRHPDIVRSCILSGSALSGYRFFERRLVAAQIPLWRQRWYWALQAKLFRIPEESLAQYIEDATAPSQQTNAAMVHEITNHRLPPQPLNYTGPILAVAAEHDGAAIRNGLKDLREIVPQTSTWIAPGVHHAWQTEAPELFARMVLQHADAGVWP